MENLLSESIAVPLDSILSLKYHNGFVWRTVRTSVQPLNILASVKRIKRFSAAPPEKSPRDNNTVFLPSPKRLLIILSTLLFHRSFATDSFGGRNEQVCCQLPFLFLSTGSRAVEFSAEPIFSRYNTVVFLVQEKVNLNIKTKVTPGFDQGFVLRTKWTRVLSVAIFVSVNRVKSC